MAIAGSETIPTPTAFGGELRPYQQRGLAWLSFLSSLGLGACLADDMGLGKTPQTLALLLAEREGRKPRKRLEPDPADLPGVGRRQLAARGRAVRAEPARARPPRPGAAEGPRVRDRGATVRDLVITTYALALRDRETLAAAQMGAGRARRGAEHQDARGQADARDPLARCRATGSRSPARRSRTA